MISERIKKLPGIDECIRYYPPNLEKVQDSESIFRGSRKIDLYVHIPFCKTPCGFCPFNQYLYRDIDVSSYITALEKEMQILKSVFDLTHFKIKTVWIGGGTPSDLKEEYLDNILRMIYENFNLERLEEFTIEVKPILNSLTDSKLQILQNYNVNRISLGVQSANQKYLKILGRGYKPEDAISIIKKIEDNNLDLNIDMIYRLPGQTVSEMVEDIKNVSSLGIDHITWFPYITYQETPLSKKISSGEIPDKVDRETYFEMFGTILEKMNDSGYQQYTPYYFSKRKKCIYHIDRWHMPQLETLGMGAGAFSFFNGWIYANAHNLSRYYELINKGKPPIIIGRPLTPIEKITRLAVLGIKFFTIQKDEFEKYSGVNMDIFYQDELKKLEELGLIELHEKEVDCTLFGKAFNNDLASYLSLNLIKGIRQPLAIRLREEGL